MHIIGHGGSSCRRPSPTCLVSQGELVNNPEVAHNWENVDCEVRDMKTVDNFFLDNLNLTQKEDKLQAVEDISSKGLDLARDFTLERSLRKHSKDFMSVTGRNVTGIEDSSRIIPGPLHIILGKGFILKIFVTVY